MQTKLESLVENIFSIIIGFIVALVSQLIIFPLYNIETTMSTNLQVVGWFTLVSVIRGYCVRRWFNYRTIRKFHKNDEKPVDYSSV